MKTPTLPGPCLVSKSSTQPQSWVQEIRREGRAGLRPGCYNAQPSETPEAGRSLAYQFPSTSFLRGRGCLCPPRVKAQPSAAGKPGRCRNPGCPPTPPRAPVINDGARKRSFGNLPQEERRPEKRESKRGGWAQRPSPSVSRGRVESWRRQTIPQPCQGHIKGCKTGDLTLGNGSLSVSLCSLREVRHLDLFGNRS